MFGILGKKARSEVGRVEALGKIPALGDFVRTPSPSDEILAFESWLTGAMETGEARAGAFKEAFTAGPAHAFLWSGAIDKKQRGLVAGVVAPSRDAVGRRFPIAIGAPLPVAALASQPHLAPILLYGFFRDAAATLSRAARMQTQAEFHAQIASTLRPSLDGLAESAERYDAWSRAERTSAAWAPLFGAGSEHAARYALAVLLEATSPYRGQETPTSSLGVRAPLGDDVALSAALWIDLARRAAGWKSTVPSVFVPLGVTRARALVLLGAETPASALVDLYAPSEDSEHTCELTPPASARMPSILPPAIDRAVDAPDATIGELLELYGR